MSYKLIALDIDGTIRTIDTPISDRTRRAVAAVRAAGAIVTLATGRIFGSAARNSAELAIDAPIASAQGAYIANPVSGEILRHRPLAQPMMRQALDALDRQPIARDMLFVAYHSDAIYVNRIDDWATAYGQRNNIAVHAVPDLRHVAHLGMTRLVVVGEDAPIQSLESNLNARLNSRLLVTRSLPHFCEILHPEGGKDSALAWMCAHFGIQQSQTIAFGNGYNDVQMLAWAGLGVAVGDAVPEALAVADRIAPPLEEHGVARILEDLLHKGLIG